MAHAIISKVSIHKNHSQPPLCRLTMFTYPDLIDSKCYKQTHSHARKVEDSLCYHKTHGKEKIGSRQKW